MLDNDRKVVIDYVKSSELDKRKINRLVRFLRFIRYDKSADLYQKLVGKKNFFYGSEKTESLFGGLVYCKEKLLGYYEFIQLQKHRPDLELQHNI